MTNNMFTLPRVSLKRQPCREHSFSVSSAHLPPSLWTPTPLPKYNANILGSIWAGSGRLGGRYLSKVHSWVTPVREPVGLSNPSSLLCIPPQPPRTSRCQGVWLGIYFASVLPAALGTLSGSSVTGVQCHGTPFAQKLRH